jgi:hypothetical protein
MKISILPPLLFAGVALAAPPLIPPSGLTPQQVAAHRQGADINARHTAAQNIVGSRADQFSALNIGSGQARSIFNNTVLSASNQVVLGSSSVSSANNLSSAYISYLSKGANASNINPQNTSNPFAMKVEKSQTQGMIFLSNPSTPIGSENKN